MKRRLQPDWETGHGWFFVEYVQFLKPGEDVRGAILTKEEACGSRLSGGGTRVELLSLKPGYLRRAIKLVSVDRMELVKVVIRIFDAGP